MPLPEVMPLLGPDIIDETESDPEDPVSSAPAASLPAQPDESIVAIEPLLVRPLANVESGRNDANPVWSPNGKKIAVERARGEEREIIVANIGDGSIADKISYQLNKNNSEMDLFFSGLLSGLFEKKSYNVGITWSPTGDSLVFMSNGGEGNYDLYLRKLDGTTVRLTKHKEKDGHAHWSPVADQLVFVSGRSGKGDVYLLNMKTRAIRPLTNGSKPFLYPQWSPDGKKIALIYGSSENHDIYVIEDVSKPKATLRALTTWPYDDLRPVWSPDGKKLAFYTNYNKAGNPHNWSIAVITADGSGVRSEETLIKNIVVNNVVPDVERGPAWLPDSKHIVYVKKDRDKYNPVHVLNLENNVSRLLKTNTRINHDVTSGRDGTIAFRAQVDQWDQIFLVKMKKLP